MKVILALLASWLAVVCTATGEEILLLPSVDFPLEGEITDDGRLPLRVHSESTPTERDDHALHQLHQFPPGRPTSSNLRNICSASRTKLTKQFFDTPEIKLLNVDLQVDAFNSLEAGFEQCCRKPEKDKLSCCTSVWRKTLDNFCFWELGVKKGYYYKCCHLEGESQRALREGCFARNAPYPNYNYKASAHQSQEALFPEGVLRPWYIPEIDFPPGQPTTTNIRNVCTLRRLRVLYADSLPKSGFPQYAYQAEALKHVEKEFEECCPKQDVTCAHKVWQETLDRYCKLEGMVKTVPHVCCGRRTHYTCFASWAPYPAYDREIQVVSLAKATPSLLDLLCGQFVLLTKKRQIPALVQNISEPCCKLPGSERTQCAENAISQFIATRCSSPEVWKDPKKCCAQTEDVARRQCFSWNYLVNISVASPVQPSHLQQKAE